jgi:hypothetical protein
MVAFFQPNPTFGHLKIVLKSGANCWIAKFLALLFYLYRIAGTVLANGTSARGAKALPMIL